MGALIINKSPSVLVKPSEPVTAVAGGLVKLSSYDKPIVGLPSMVSLVFDQQVEDPAESIKRGLSKALHYYYPMSGRLAAGGATGSEVVVQCNGEGVPFVVASANCAIDDVHDELNDPSVHEDLLILYPAGRGLGLHPDPLLMVQVTVFSCGGFVVGLTWDHSISDAKGIAQFMEAVGELSRGLPSPTVIPVRSDNSLLPVRQTSLGIFSLLPNLQQSPLVFLEIRIPSVVINRIKQDFSISGAGARTCSVFEVLTAVVWQCRTRVIMDDDPEAPTMLSFGANARKYAGAKDGYYGNCVALALLMTTCGDVANGDIIDVIKMIQRAKDKIPTQYSSDEHQGLQELDANKNNLVGYSILRVTNWRNLGMENTDFGGGRPARMMIYTKSSMAIPMCVSGFPWKNQDFFSVTSLCVKEEHAGAFLHELANFT